MKLTASLARTWVQDKLVISTNYEKNQFVNFPQIITDKYHQNHFHGPTIFGTIQCKALYKFVHKFVLVCSVF